MKKENQFPRGLYKKAFFEIDGVRVTYKILFDGEPNLFELQPSTHILSRFETKSFINLYDDECGSFTLDFEYTNDEFESKGDSAIEYV